MGKETALTEWVAENSEYADSDDGVTYRDFAKYFARGAAHRKWGIRKGRDPNTIGRMYSASPSDVGILYLRLF